MESCRHSSSVVVVADFASGPAEKNPALLAVGVVGLGFVAPVFAPILLARDSGVELVERRTKRESR